MINTKFRKTKVASHAKFFIFKRFVYQLMFLLKLAHYLSIEKFTFPKTNVYRVKKNMLRYILFVFEYFKMCNMMKVKNIM